MADITKLDLLTQDYPSRSLDENQSELVNMYLEVDKSKGKYSVIALPTPGLTEFKNTGQANVRAIVEHNNVVYAIAGSILISITSDGTQTTLGNLNTSTGFAKIVVITGSADNNNQLFVIDGVNGYYYNLGTSTGQFPVTDVDFPQDAIDITTQDEYIIAANKNSIKFNISNVSDASTWNALDFASKLGEPDRLVAVLSHQSKIWLFGTKTTEIWYNSGNELFPFQRIPDTFLHYGCVSKRSVSKNKDSIYFLGCNEKGGVQIYKAQPSVAYVPTVISTPPYDSLISSFSVVDDAIGYCYVKDGHEFYEISFPTAGYTFTFDNTSGVWSKRKSFNGSIYTGCKIVSQAYAFNKNLVGTSNSGIIYVQDTFNYTENNVPIQRQFVSPPVYVDGRRVFIPRLQIDVETGIGDNKTFTLEKSMDNGATWSLVKEFTVPPKGGRIYATCLGSTRYGALFRITTTMAGKFIILGFLAELFIGHN